MNSADTNIQETNSSSSYASELIEQQQNYNFQNRKNSLEKNIQEMKKL